MDRLIGGQVAGIDKNYLELDFKRFELEDDLIRVARSASGNSIGRGILDSQGISADGGAT